jgi:hypothetical protein
LGFDYDTIFSKATRLGTLTNRFGGGHAAINPPSIVQNFEVALPPGLYRLATTVYRPDGDRWLINS